MGGPLTLDGRNGQCGRDNRRPAEANACRDLKSELVITLRRDINALSLKNENTTKLREFLRFVEEDGKDY